MRIIPVLATLCAFYGATEASVGDLLPEFKSCVQQCISVMHCHHNNVFEEIDASREGRYKRDESEEFIEAILTREVSKAIADSDASISRRDFPKEDFTYKNQLSPLFRVFWNCDDDCNYKCQQLITDHRRQVGLPMVQFFGKWPFTRILGIQEFFSVVFSLGNFYVVYINLFKVLHQYNKNKKDPNDKYHIMLKQYLNFLMVALCGWLASTLFHIRDNSVTETMDYFGAFAIVLSNFNCIAVRYFEIFKDKGKLTIWQGVLVVIYVLHCLKLKNNWDYNYNANINLVFGVASIILWVSHSLKVNRRYKENYILYNNSIQLLPFETKILTKLNVLSMSEAKYIPLIPVFLNIWMVFGMSFELLDFEPIYRLVDAHCLWHLFTIFPPIIWFDWNIWDIELSKLGDTNKIN